MSDSHRSSHRGEERRGGGLRSGAPRQHSSHDRRSHSSSGADRRYGGPRHTSSSSSSSHRPSFHGKPAYGAKKSSAPFAKQGTSFQRNKTHTDGAGRYNEHQQRQHGQHRGSTGFVSKSRDCAHPAGKDARRGLREANQGANHRNRQTPSPTDLSLVAKVAQDLRTSVSHFKSRMTNVQTFAPELNTLLAFVPPPFIAQHIPEGVGSFRSYLDKLERGAANAASGFIAWYEWASYEVNRQHGGNRRASGNGPNTNHTQHASQRTHDTEHDDGHEDEDETEMVGREKATEEADDTHDGGSLASTFARRNKSSTLQRMAQTLREREHMRALLSMSVRHSHLKRKQGQHALLHHLQTQLAMDGVDARSLDALDATAHHTVSYALTRLVLGMATADLAMILLHCQTLWGVCAQTEIAPAVVLAVINRELALGSRMKAVQIRLEASATKSTAVPKSAIAAANAHTNNSSSSVHRAAEEDSDAEEEALDTDEINDPTISERNQRLTAAVFAMVALLAADATRTNASQGMPASDAAQMATFLCFCYVEQKAIRVLSGNALLHLLRRRPALLQEPAVAQWVRYAFFHYPKMEYFRPEAIQLLLWLMTKMQPHTHPHATQSPASDLWGDSFLPYMPATVQEYAQLDPLRPSVLEQLVQALFRKDHITAVHPMLHPVWDDLLALVRQRCAESGESMKEHVGTIIHIAVAPYRRGHADLPRRVLFQSLITKLGQLVVQSSDAEERAAMLQMASTQVGYGKRTIAKPTPLTELRQLSVAALRHKITDLFVQYRQITDRTPACTTHRTWILRELRHCLCVPVRNGSCAVATGVEESGGVGSSVQGTAAASAHTPRAQNYIDACALALLEWGFYPQPPTRDDRSSNRCIFLFADCFSFTLQAAMTRPRCQLSGLHIIHAYLTAEEAGKTRYTTALQHNRFRKARNSIVEALEQAAEQRSVLFYDARDMEILLTLLFLMLSVDDASNSEAVTMASTVVRDVVHIFAHGTLEHLEVWLDALMTLIMRRAAPIHVAPLLTCVRRVAMGFVLKFARYIRTTAALDVVLSPLREAYKTDMREVLRQQRMKSAKGENNDHEGSAEDNTDGDEEDAEDTDVDESSSDASLEEGEEEDKGGRARTSLSTTSHKSAAAAQDEDDDEDAVDTETESDTAEDTASAISSSSSGDDDDAGERDDDDDNDAHEQAKTEWDTDEEGVPNAAEEEEANLALYDEDEEVDEAPTAEYLAALKRMVGAEVDLDHTYVNDTANSEKSVAVRAMQLAARVGASLRSSLVIHVFQVLLAVARECVKMEDDVVFDGALSAVNILLLTRHRYYGSFVEATALFPLLGDIQSYARKTERALLSHAGSAYSPKAAAACRRRLRRLKEVALRVFHFVSFLAYKNHAGEEHRITLMEYYASIFCDRGWDGKHSWSALKKDLFHYRHSFAWALLPAALHKWEQTMAHPSPQRVRLFEGCCTFVEAMLSRLSGIPATLKRRARGVMCAFVQQLSLADVYRMRPILVYRYLHTIKMMMQYNSRVQLDRDWVVREIIDKAVDNDGVGLSSASIRAVAALERLAQTTPRIVQTKAAVPVHVLYRTVVDTATEDTTGDETTDRVKQSDAKRRRINQSARRVRARVVKSLLSHRNMDESDAVRAQRRRRREELRIEDHVQRQVLRDKSKTPLSRAEREEKRKFIIMAKQDRIAKNRERKRRLQAMRQRSFEKWRQNKLAATISAVDQHDRHMQEE